MSFAIGEYFDCYLVLVLTVCLLVLTDNNIAVCESALPRVHYILLALL